MTCFASVSRGRLTSGNKACSGCSRLRSAQRLPGADVTAHCDGSTDQLRSCFLDGPVGDRRVVGRLTIALADTLISLEVRALRSAETRVAECASMPIRRMEFDDKGHGLLQEWRPRSFPMD